MDAGWKKKDLCTAEAADTGSHFVCVNLPTDFWVKTGQAKDEADAEKNWPKSGPWCICMWAYANYLRQEPDFVDEVKCDATNSWVLQKYNKGITSQCNALFVPPKLLKGKSGGQSRI